MNLTTIPTAAPHYTTTDLYAINLAMACVCGILLGCCLFSLFQDMCNKLPAQIYTLIIVSTIELSKWLNFFLQLCS